MEYLGNESEEVNGVGVVGKRKNNASRKMLAPLISGRARGRAPWLTSLKGLKSRVCPTFSGVPFTVDSPSDGSVGSP